MILFFGSKKLLTDFYNVSGTHGDQHVALGKIFVQIVFDFRKGWEIFAGSAEFYNALLDIFGGDAERTEYKEICNRLFITTDDGSYGEKGFVTNKLQSLIDEGNNYDLVIAIGPIPMMKFVSKVTEPYNIKTLVSLNPIMIDGTGMCGGCRVTVGGEIKFACVDGPDFDGHKVDYDELMQRNSTYRDFEAHDRENCRMFKAADNMGGAK